MNILVTGAAGYIGSHVLVQLLQAGFDVIAVDNHSNSESDVYERVRQLSGRTFAAAHMDVRDTPALSALVKQYAPAACMHFAAYKAVGESQEQPERYWNNNIGCLTSVLEAMQTIGARRIVFSSSATVYGLPDTVPVRESAALRPASVYAQTKLAGENILSALAEHPTPWSVARLRYFNPIGAHPSGLLGEAPRGTPNNLMPYVTQVAAGIRDVLHIYGDDYPTPDGSCIRDYIHVMDLADGHIAALNHLLQQAGSFVVNLGTGQGTSVFELVKTFEAVNGVTLPTRIAPRRAGDVPEYFANSDLAYELLGWRAGRGIDAMCRDAWRWQMHSAAKSTP